MKPLLACLPQSFRYTCRQYRRSVVVTHQRMFCVSHWPTDLHKSVYAAYCTDVQTYRKVDSLHVGAYCPTQSPTHKACAQVRQLARNCKLCTDHSPFCLASCHQQSYAKVQANMIHSVLPTYSNAPIMRQGWTSVQQCHEDCQGSPDSYLTGSHWLTCRHHTADALDGPEGHGILIFTCNGEKGV